MGLRLPDDWIWDFWFAADGRDVHVFFLHAPRALGDPELRHRNARIGHAVSRDLTTWDPLSPPFSTEEPDDFDDLATWTGSVVQHGDIWQMFYTGISTLEDGAVQRIGVATSADLVGWEKHGVVSEADPRWYETLGPGVREQSWRDPCVFASENDGPFHMLVTARADSGPADGRGVIGHAHSDDLRTWQAGPPLSEPGEFYALEVPQLVDLGGRPRIVFSVPSGWHSAARLARPGVVAESGTHYLVARDEQGPYRLERDGFLFSEPGSYGGRLLCHEGRWHFFAWRGYDEKGEFLGDLSDPMPVTIGPDGSVALASTSRRSRRS